MIKFSTERLMITELSRDDLQKPFIHSLCVRIPTLLTAKVVENLPPYFHNIASVQDARKWLETLLAESVLLMVESRESEEVVGFLFASPCDDGAHIGYLLAESHWGKGLASELLLAFMAHSSQQEQWHALIGGVDQSNVASIKLLEKLGFVAMPHDRQQSVVFYQYLLLPNSGN
jgi:RimJ/RimL family protein N-acetyltransferase